MSDPRQFVDMVFAAVDTLDPGQFVPFLTADCNFELNSAPPLIGRDDIQASMAILFRKIAVLRHDIKQLWAIDDHILSRVDVDYTRPDGVMLTCKSATIWQLDGALIRNYRIFIDNSAVFAA